MRGRHSPEFAVVVRSGRNPSRRRRQGGQYPHNQDQIAHDRCSLLATHRRAERNRQSGCAARRTRGILLPALVHFSASMAVGPRTCACQKAARNESLPVSRCFWRQSKQKGTPPSSAPIGALRPASGSSIDGSGPREALTVQTWMQRWETEAMSPLDKKLKKEAIEGKIPEPIEDLPSEWAKEDREIEGGKPDLGEVDEDPSER